MRTRYRLYRLCGYSVLEAVKAAIKMAPAFEQKKGERVSSETNVRVFVTLLLLGSTFAGFAWGFAAGVAIFFLVCAVLCGLEFTEWQVTVKS